MWDEVYVDKEIVKIDYSVGCKGTLLNKLNNLISLVRKKSTTLVLKIIKIILLVCT